MPKSGAHCASHIVPLNAASGRRHTYASLATCQASLLMLCCHHQNQALAAQQDPRQQHQQRGAQPPAQPALTQAAAPWTPGIR